MTYFLNFRAQPVGGGVNDPVLWEGDGTTAAKQWSLVPSAQIPGLFRGKNVLFATHGFNVDQKSGANALGLLDKYLALAPPALFVAMLWPGDSFMPIVDYPFEGSVAIQAGNELADFCNTSCAAAQSLSFASHSLGARFVLQAVSQLNGKARSVCLAAAAVNQDCLTTEYAAATQKAERISLLASHEDDVLKIAFAVGDPFADLLHDDHSPFEPALGYDGPPAPPPQPVQYPWQIPDADDYGHSDYLPPTDPNRWPNAADFIKRAFLGQSQTWPTG
jgi:hypothetical protein